MLTFSARSPRSHKSSWRSSFPGFSNLTQVLSLRVKNPPSQLFLFKWIGSSGSVFYAILPRRLWHPYLTYLTRISLARGTPLFLSNLSDQRAVYAEFLFFFFGRCEVGCSEQNFGCDSLRCAASSKHLVASSPRGGPSVIDAFAPNQDPAVDDLGSTCSPILFTSGKGNGLVDFPQRVKKVAQGALQALGPTADCSGLHLETFCLRPRYLWICDSSSLC